MRSHRMSGAGRFAMVAVTGAALAACAETTATPTAASADPMAIFGGRADLHELEEGRMYEATLTPLNARAQAIGGDARGGVSGKAYFRVTNGMLYAVVDAKHVEPADAGTHPLEGLHPQHIHEADRCPSMGDDANRDGFLDVIEGLPKYGPIMIPLDGMLSDTTSQVATFPFGMADGTLRYSASGSVPALLGLLGHPLALPTRHVVLHGISLTTPLPASVQTLPGVPAQLTLPVACGAIREVR